MISLVENASVIYRLIPSIGSYSRKEDSMKLKRVELKLAATGISVVIALLVFEVSIMAKVPKRTGVTNVFENSLVIGHRGIAGLLPENTLAGFKRACELGVDAIEFDLMVTADGVLVVHHDFKLNPATTRAAGGDWVVPNSRPAIIDLTLAQLKTYDVGRLNPNTRYATRYPYQTPVDGERIPTFKELLDTFKKSCSSSTQLFVEIKTTPEKPNLTPSPRLFSDMVVKMLREEGLAERAWILSFDWRNLMHVQKIAPELPTVYLTIDLKTYSNLKPNLPGPSPWMGGMDIDDFNGSVPKAVKAAGGRIWSPYYRNLSNESLVEARQLGLMVSIWTLDKPDDMKRFIEMRVDAITTNRADILKYLLIEK